jgi:soluble lytic murein transglycosylase
MLSSQFDGNFMLATAGYNAGPGRSKAWVAKYGCLPADAWVEMIPFSETKTYVKRVLFFTSVFEARLGLPSQPMRVVLPSDSCSASNDTAPLETTAPIEAESSESNS